MHTAEHVLNKTMDQMFGCGRCFSAHINPKKSKCDYRFDHEPDESRIEEVQRRVNEVLGASLQVEEVYLPLEQAAQQFDLSRLPEGSGNRVRIVKIGDYDACPCIGEHVSNTSETGNFKISTYSFSEDVLRIRFKLTK